jgi:hypothetical protein
MSDSEDENFVEIYEAEEEEDDYEDEEEVSVPEEDDEYDGELEEELEDDWDTTPKKTFKGKLVGSPSNLLAFVTLLLTSHTSIQTTKACCQ